MFQSFSLAVQNIRANLFHTFLSVLGIVIGVAALVATFSLIDGLEKFARDTIAGKTSLNVLAVATETHKTINNLPVKKDSFQVVNYEQFSRLKADIPLAIKSNLSTSFNREIKLDDRDSSWGARIMATAEMPWSDTVLAVGQFISPEALANGARETVINATLAKLIAGENEQNTLPGKTIILSGKPLKIVGVAKAQQKDAPPIAVIPIRLLSIEELQQSPPSLELEMAKTEDVAVAKTQVEAWLEQEYGAGKSDFTVYSQDHWIGEAAKGFTIFRIVMGLIIGISVVVGGIGVMNVLLISVNERTAEIGLRKALGAKSSDIRKLFLAESITVSAFGSLLGLVFGAGFAMLVIPIIRYFADVPFSAVLTWNTFLVISVVAVLIGIIFGTYPAVKAAKLDPVEALRRE